jgi:hypothetical protein
MHNGAARSFLKAAAFTACVATLAWSSCAHADGSSTPYGRGGMRFPQMDQIIQQYNKSGELFRIEGECRSSCTELLAIKNVCVNPSATIEFHAALQSPDQPVSAARNSQMASYYHASLRSFVVANHYMDSWTFHPMSGQELISKFGYRQCPGR